MIKRRIFLNLTNGLEALERYNLKLENVSFVRIQSSHCEAHDFEAILWDIDHNLLMSLAQGIECIIYDFGAKSNIPKAVYLGINWIYFILNQRWFGNSPDIYAKGKKLNQLFDLKSRNLSKKIQKKLDFYKNYLNTNKIIITSVCDFTLNDNNPAYYNNIIKKSK